MALVANGGSAGVSTRRKSPRTRGRVVEGNRATVPQPFPTPLAPAASGPSTRSTSGGGGGGGGSGGRSFSRSAPVSSPAPAPDPGPSRAERQAEQRAREAEQARQRQLAEMRESIERLPLDPNLVAAFAERGRLADRGVAEAQAFGQRARGQSETDFSQFLAQLGQQVDESQMGLRQEAAARNLAFQPHFVGRGQRDIRDEAQESRALAEQQRAVFLTGIARQIEQARASREAEVAAIARDKARAQSDHRAFIDAQLAALGQ